MASPPKPKKLFFSLAFTSSEISRRSPEAATLARFTVTSTEPEPSSGNVRPVLDQAQQTLRLTDIQLAVESEAAFGLLGAAARAAVPHLQRALAEKATIDLKPFASNAQKKIAAVIADFQKNEDGLRVAAEITSLRLADIAFDSKTLRVIAEAEGTINVAVSKLSGL